VLHHWRCNYRQRTYVKAFSRKYKKIVRNYQFLKTLLFEIKRLCNCLVSVSTFLSLLARRQGHEDMSGSRLTLVSSPSLLQ
jgi:hypothetical protein